MGSNISVNDETVTIPVGSHIRVVVANYMEENTNNNQPRDFSLLKTVHMEQILVGLGVRAHTVFISRLWTAVSTMSNA